MTVATMRAFLLGFGIFLRGFNLLRHHPRLVRLALVPLLLDVLILVGILWWVGAQIPVWVQAGVAWVLTDPTSWITAVLYWPILLIAWVVLFAALYLVGHLLARAVAAPFNGLLAEESLQILRPTTSERISFRQRLAQFLRMQRVALVKTLLFVMAGVALLLLSLLPAIGFAAALAMLLLMAFDAIDYSFEVEGFELSQRLRFFRHHMAVFAGVATAFAIALLIPGFNLLLYPVAVVGGADLLHRIQQH